MIKIDLPTSQILDKETLYQDLKEHFEGTYDVSLYGLGWGKKGINTSVRKSKWVGAVVQLQSKKNQIWVSGMFPKAKQTVFVLLFIGWLFPILFLRKKWNSFENEIAESVSQKYHGTYYRYPLWKEFLPVFVLLLSLFIAYIVVSEYYPNPQSTSPIYDETIVSDQLPTVFRTPTPDGPPHIVGAEIERITIPGCDTLNGDDCASADIILKMDGVSDGVINEINRDLTSYLFENSRDTIPTDIRIPSLRKVNKTVTVEAFAERIVYIDATKKIIKYNYVQNLWSIEDGHLGSHALEEGDEFLVISEDGQKIVYPSLFTPMVPTNNSDDFEYTRYDLLVLEHFYPNFEEILEKEKIQNECYANVSKDDLGPTINPQAREVIFRNYFRMGDECNDGGELQIAIPIVDILREVPQYVPKDSVLWRFADN